MKSFLTTILTIQFFLAPALWANPDNNLSRGDLINQSMDMADELETGIEDLREDGWEWFTANGEELNILEFIQRGGKEIRVLSPEGDGPRFGLRVLRGTIGLKKTTVSLAVMDENFETKITGRILKIDTNRNVVTNQNRIKADLNWLTRSVRKKFGSTETTGLFKKVLNFLFPKAYAGDKPSVFGPSFKIDSGGPMTSFKNGTAPVTILKESPGVIIDHAPVVLSVMNKIVVIMLIGAVVFSIGGMAARGAGGLLARSSVGGMLAHGRRARVAGGFVMATAIFATISGLNGITR